MLGVSLWSALATFNPIAFLTGNMIKFAAGAALIATFVMWDHQRIERNRQEERTEVINEVNDANNRATEAGQASANASGRPKRSGVRSPRYRD